MHTSIHGTQTLVPETKNVHISLVSSGLLTGCTGAEPHNLIKSVQSRTISKNLQNSCTVVKKIVEMIIQWAFLSITSISFSAQCFTFQNNWGIAYTPPSMRSRSWNINKAFPKNAVDWALISALFQNARRRNKTSFIEKANLKKVWPSNKTVFLRNLWFLQAGSMVYLSLLYDWRAKFQC